MNSTRPIENHEMETHGLGLIQVEKAFEIIQQAEKVHFRPVFEIIWIEQNQILFSKSIKSINVNDKMKGIYIRQPSLGRSPNYSFHLIGQPISRHVCQRQFENHNKRIKS